MGSKPIILIVDDTPDNLRILGSLLEEEYDVRIATNGADALAIVRATSPGLILLDIMMPGMDGFEVCRQLKANSEWKRVPVIFISALDAHEQKIQAFREGAVDYITKPFQADEVVARVRTHLQLSRMEELKREIAERKRAEEELGRYRDHLEELVEERTRKLTEAQQQIIRAERLAALGELIATVSHELCNPLGTIRGCLFILREMHSGEDTAEASTIARAERNIERCTRIIEQMLELTQVKTIVPVTVDCDDWLRATLENLELPDGIELSVSLGKPGNIDIDPPLMKRCIEILVTNACDAVADAGYKDKNVAISTAAVDSTVELCIRDSGTGISSEHAKRIWEPLFTTKGFGVGLSLPHVKHVVDLHGGDIWHTSDPANGTAFTISLPKATV